MARKQSRLNRRIEKKSKQNLILSLLGIVVILFLVLQVGIPLLVNFSLFIGQQKDSAASQSPNSSNSSFIAPPILNPVPSATNSAELAVSGNAVANEDVKIYVNGQLEDQVPTKNDGSFSLVIDLKKGFNTIAAKSHVKDKDSNTSETVTTNYIDTKPTLDLASPSDGQTFSKDQKNAQVSGKTSSGAKVTVNGFWAIVSGDGNFSYSLPLQNGENQIKIIATDNAENTTEKEIKVIYNP